jgi:hypothetical protein
MFQGLPGIPSQIATWRQGALAGLAGNHITTAGRTSPARPCQAAAAAQRLPWSDASCSKRRRCGPWSAPARPPSHRPPAVGGSKTGSRTKQQDKQSSGGGTQGWHLEECEGMPALLALWPRRCPCLHYRPLCGPASQPACRLALPASQPSRRPQRAAPLGSPHPAAAPAPPPRGHSGKS